MVIEITFQRRKITKPCAEKKETVTDAAEERRSKIVKRAALEFHDGLYGILDSSEGLTDHACIHVTVAWKWLKQ